MSNRKFVDLFAGAGGLSLGLRVAGFASALAVEASPQAAETYFRNFVDPRESEWQRHQAESLEAQIRRGLGVSKVETVLQQDDLMTLLRDVDLVAGGPPCQGFSLAGLRNPEDQRNSLPYQFLRFVSLLNPKLVLIENVKGIAAGFRGAPRRHSVLSDLATALMTTGAHGYITQVLLVDASHFDVPQRRPRVLVAALRSDLARTYAGTSDRDELQLALTVPLWNSARPSAANAEALLAPVGQMSTLARTAGSALDDLDDSGYRLPLSEYTNRIATARELRSGGRLASPLVGPLSAPDPPNHALRRHSARVTARFRFHQALAQQDGTSDVFRFPGIDVTEDPDAALAVARDRVSHMRLPLRDRDDRPLTDEHGQPIGSDPDLLADALVRLASLKHSQQVIRPERPAPTVMSLPDDFIHYSSPRTLTVREMARLQGFPDRFVFHGRETTGSHRRKTEVPQYTQVGNAVPPRLAAVIGEHLLRVLEGADPNSSQPVE